MADSRDSIGRMHIHGALFAATAFMLAAADPGYHTIPIPKCASQRLPSKATCEDRSDDSEDTACTVLNPRDLPDGAARDQRLRERPVVESCACLDLRSNIAGVGSVSILWRP